MANEESHERRSGWADYQQLVMSELKYLRLGLDSLTLKMDVYKDYHDDRLEKNLKDITEEFTKLKIEMTKIKSYAAAYGSMAALIVTILLHFWKL